MTIRVRPAGVDDARSIVAMSRDFSAEEEQDATTFGIDDFHRYGCGTERLFDPVIAELDNRAVGYAFSVRSFDTQLACPVREIIDLYVDPAYRRRGVGRQLVDALADHARRNGEAAMIVRVWNKNVAAHKFYQSSGAREDHVKVFYWDWTLTS